MQYTVILEPTATGYSVYVPDLPGCVAAADTKMEALELIRGAIEFHLEGMREDGELVPQPSAESELVEVVA